MAKNKLSQEEQQTIRNKYLELKNIEKTAKLLGYSKITVNKYVKDISCASNKSRYNNLKVYQIDSKTGKIIRVFKNSNLASKVCHISLSNLNQCLKHRTKSAGGYCWVYENELTDFELPKKIHQSYIRQEDILLGLL